MYTNLCILIEMSMDIRIIKFWVAIESCVTLGESHFSTRLMLRKLAERNLEFMCRKKQEHVSDVEGDAKNLQFIAKNIYFMSYISFESIKILKRYFNTSKYFLKDSYLVCKSQNDVLFHYDI